VLVKVSVLGWRWQCAPAQSSLPRPHTACGPCKHASCPRCQRCAGLRRRGRCVRLCACVALRLRASSGLAAGCGVRFDVVRGVDARLSRRPRSRPRRRHIRPGRRGRHRPDAAAAVGAAGGALAAATQASERGTSHPRCGSGAGLRGPSCHEVRGEAWANAGASGEALAAMVNEGSARGARVSGLAGSDTCGGFATLGARRGGGSALAPCPWQRGRLLETGRASSSACGGRACGGGSREGAWAGMRRPGSIVAYRAQTSVEGTGPERRRRRDRGTRSLRVVLAPERERGASVSLAGVAARAGMHMGRRGRHWLCARPCCGRVGDGCRPAQNASACL
jgi:hypothetical protein